MIRMQSYSSTVPLCLILFVFGTVLVHGEPEPMARPTRPEVFTSPEELRKYLDHVSDYYSLSGKARYGKRGNILSSTSDVNQIWDTVIRILENSRRPHRPQFQKQKQEDGRFFNEIEGADNNNHAPRIETRPCHMLDIGERY